MAPNDSQEFSLIDSDEPKIQLHRLKNIITYEVMASDLDRLEDAAGEEKNAAAFCSMAFGVLMGAILGWPASDATAKRMAIHVSLTAIFGAMTLWFGATWWRKFNSHKQISAHIRRSAVLVARDKAGSKTQSTISEVST